MVAIKQVLQAPERFGFSISESQRYPPLDFETALIDCYEPVPIRLLAEAAGTYFKTIKDLNPHIRGHYLQTGRHQINLPTGQSRGYQKRVDQLVAQYVKAKEKQIYVAQGG